MNYSVLILQTEDLKSSGSGSYTSSGYGSQIAMEDATGEITEYI
jgi:hypothetical protein